MSKTIRVLNEILVELFNDILDIEQATLSQGEFKDISITEMHTIEAIGMYDSKTMSEIAQRLGITIGTLTIAVNNLVKKGYVERNRSEKDRRVVMVGLTRRGKLAFRIHQKFHDDFVKATIDGLTDQEEEILIKSLSKLNNFFKEKYDLQQNGEKE